MAVGGRGGWVGSGGRVRICVCVSVRWVGESGEVREGGREEERTGHRGRDLGRIL